MHKDSTEKGVPHPSSFHCTWRNSSCTEFSEQNVFCFVLFSGKKK